MEFSDMMDLDMNAVALALLFTLVFGGMVWLVPTWKVMAFGWKLAMTLIMPVLFYAVSVLMLNR